VRKYILILEEKSIFLEKNGNFWSANKATKSNNKNLFDFCYLKKKLLLLCSFS